jgi:hypothetical protein
MDPYCTVDQTAPVIVSVRGPAHIIKTRWMHTYSGTS